MTVTQLDRIEAQLSGLWRMLDELRFAEMQRRAQRTGGCIIRMEEPEPFAVLPEELRPPT